MGQKGAKKREYRYTRKIKTKERRENNMNIRQNRI